MPCQTLHQQHKKLGFLQLPSTVLQLKTNPASLGVVWSMWQICEGPQSETDFFIIQLDESMPCLVSERPWWPELLSQSAAEGSFGYQYTGMKGHILGPAFGYQHDLASLAHSMDHRQQSHAWILAIQGQARTSEKEELSWKYRGKSALLYEKVSYV